MLVILKIPVVYLCAVVWYAIRAEPLPPRAGRQARVAADGPSAGRARLAATGTPPPRSARLARSRSYARVRGATTTVLERATRGREPR